MRRAICLVAALTMIILFGSPNVASAQTSPSSTGDVIVLTGDIITTPGTTYDRLVTFNGDIRQSGTATSDVVALNGDVNVLGHIEGNVVATNGRITLQPTARVDGDVRSSDTPTVLAGATVGGTTETINTSDIANTAGVVSRYALWIAVTVSTLIFGLLLMWLLPRVADSSRLAFRSVPGTAVGWGVIMHIVLPILAIVAMASLLASPFGLGLAMTTALLTSTGYVVGAYIIGRWTLQNTTSHIVPFLVGWLILRVLALVPFVGGLAWIVSAIIGVGGLSVAIWRSRNGHALGGASEGEMGEAGGVSAATGGTARRDMGGGEATPA